MYYQVLVFDQLFRLMGRLMEMLLIEYKRVGLSGKQPPESYVIGIFQVDQKVNFAEM